jgi:GrpB-like predicted nucleotidyltransferase (UPF0157 family)
MPAIEIIDSQSRWPAEFAAYAATLRAALGPLALAINHIGSTSVPGLEAKDVIDIQVSVRTLDIAEPLYAAFQKTVYRLRRSVGFDHVPKGEDADPQRWAKRMAGEREGDRRTHIHIRVRGSPNERYALLFRDYLRANPAAAASYGLIKRELAALHPDDADADAYYAVKDPVCDLVIDAAEPWAAATLWRLPPSEA